MPTTSNFGWTTPADTDLVKDGAAAIRTLGNGIDTSLVDLKGGTTGQVLSKASNTDLDFTWSSVDPLTILDAKGDLISATAADTPARLASSGVNGDVLTVDTSTSTGLKWAAPAAGAFTSLASGSLSGTELNLTSISGSYKDLRLVIKGAYVNVASVALMRINGVTTASSYLTRAVTSTVDQRTTSFWNPTNTNLPTTSNNHTWIFDFPDYTNSSFKIMFFQNSGDNAFGSGYQNTVTAAVSAIRFWTADSSTFNGGTYELFGVK